MRSKDDRVVILCPGVSIRKGLIVCHGCGGKFALDENIEAVDLMDMAFTLPFLHECVSTEVRYNRDKKRPTGRRQRQGKMRGVLMRLIGKQEYPR